MDSTSVYPVLVGLAVYASARRKPGQSEEALQDIAEQNEVGLIPIYEPEPPLAVDVDVILVHGLQSDPFEAWKALKKSWPKDFLAKDVPTARILTFGYGNLESELATSIKGLGQLLLGSISFDRAQHGNATRPIIFVAHSFGGLIVKSVRTRSNLVEQLTYIMPGSGLF
ncbi:hypothetical protein GP486_002692 [Trichoglossum hirsutum]|uniref:DUF676 domain-containing protein n=1 Tax=Trichoglossum hirsutum TaxID=265104 RepID=A0A9P8LEG6_9PEZI|nr:hypothetical protein GP486_002692 [Trichoglossum hirsutum]